MVNKSNISTNTRRIFTKLKNKAATETATASANKLVRVRNCIVRIKRLKLDVRDATITNVYKTTAQVESERKEICDNAQERTSTLQSGGIQCNGKIVGISNVRARNKTNISTNTRRMFTKLKNKAATETATATLHNKVLGANQLVRVRNCIVRIKRLKLDVKDATITNVHKTTAQVESERKEVCDNVQERTSTLQSGGIQCNEKIVGISNVHRAATYKKNVDRQQHSGFLIKPCRVRILRCPTVQDIAQKQLENSQPAQFADVGRKPLSDMPARDCSQQQSHVSGTRCGERILLSSSMQKTHKDIQENSIKPTRVHRFFHRDQPPARTRSSVTRQVYDFLSQSQIEDHEKPDPAADIIQNMIENGRACAMIRSKTGKSRARAVRKKVRAVGKRKHCSVRTVGKESKVVREAEQRCLSPICEKQNDLTVNIEPAQNGVAVQVPHMTAMAHKTNVEGAYSPLARSLMLNQTKAQQFPDRRLELLHMAKQCISTPVNRRSNIAMDANTIFSPVVGSSDTGQMLPVPAVTTGNRSPWRVADETSLPNTFEFSLNRSQLPSYSSDFIRKRHVYLPDEPSCSTSIERQTSSAGNDSNRENVPPAATVTEPSAEPQSVTTIKPIDDQANENVENIVQLPNPRRALQYRSPLKDINILDVLVLPSWKKNVQQLNNTPTKESLSRNQQLKLNSNSPRHQSERGKEQQQRSPCNLFGFEEFLTEEDEVEYRELNKSETLHEKLHRLKQLRPAPQELPQVSQAPMRHVYDDLNAREPRQRNIKDMLCSTMIGTEPTNESLALFKDFEPETTFDDKKPRRTYVAEKPKRKRKQRVHVLFIDSESSENEEEDNEHGSKNNSDELPKKAVPPQKRTRRDAEYEKKLQQFITSFNQECSEVEKFPLMIE